MDGIHRSQILGTLFCMRSIFEISWPQTETEGQYTVCTREKIKQSDSINCMGPVPQGARLELHLNQLGDPRDILR